MSSELRDHTALNRYEMDVGDDVAFLTYRRNGNRIHLMHTEVPAELRGQGAGTRLVRAVLDRARAEGVTVVPHCPFVKAFLRDHSAYESLVRPPPSEP